MLKITHLARKNKISTVSKAVKIESGNRFRHIKKRLLTAAMKQKQLEQCSWLLNNLKNHGNWIIIFLDEMTLTVDPVVNNQNNQVVSFG